MNMCVYIYYIYMMHNVLFKAKDMEGNITYHYIVILGKTQHCAGGTILHHISSHIIIQHVCFLELFVGGGGLRNFGGKKDFEPVPLE